jgi:preprotein translocase subunit YajC
MKCAYAIPMILVLATSLQANACPGSNGELICSGDTIVTNDNIAGVVIGVNSFTDAISFSDNRLHQTFTRNKQTLAIGAGCLELYCVGDQVVTNDNIRGKILAVNPYQNTIAFSDNRSNNIHTTSSDSLSLALGCVLGICVGDEVITPDNIRGEVLAVNPTHGIVALSSNRTANVFSRDATSLSSAKNCAAYGTAARALRSYPQNSAVYADGNFKFSQQRPQLP